MAGQHGRLTRAARQSRKRAKPSGRLRLPGDLRRGCEHDPGHHYRPPGHDDLQEDLRL